MKGSGDFWNIILGHGGGLPQLCWMSLGVRKIWKATVLPRWCWRSLSYLWHLLPGAIAGCQLGGQPHLLCDSQMHFFFCQFQTNLHNYFCHLKAIFPFKSLQMRQEAGVSCPVCTSFKHPQPPTQPAATAHRYTRFHFLRESMLWLLPWVSWNQWESCEDCAIDLAWFYKMTSWHVGLHRPLFHSLTSQPKAVSGSDDGEMVLETIIILLLVQRCDEY